MVLGKLVHRLAQVPAKGPQKTKLIFSFIGVFFAFASLEMYALVKTYSGDMTTMSPQWIEATKKYRQAQNMDPPALTGRPY